MRVVMIRTNGVNPDPRVEKEVNSILRTGKHSVTVLAWDRDHDKNTKGFLSLSNGKTRIYRFGVRSEWGGGFKKNMIPLLHFSIRVHHWLKVHKDEYDCIHCCDLPTAIMAMPYIKYKKFVYDIYDFFADTAHAPNIVLEYARRKEKKMIERADVTIICSEKRKKQLGDAMPRKLVVVHNSPDATILDGSRDNQKHVINSDSKRTKIVYVGNLIEERFVDVVADIVAENPELELHVGGIGPLSDVLSRKADVYENIVFYGKMQYADVLALEKECDVMLALYDPRIPNNRYAAPNKFYEALLVGKPLVMIKNTGMDEIVERERIGVVSCSYKKDDLKKAILKAAQMASEDRTIGKRTQLLYENYYSWHVMDERINSLYDAL